MKHYNTFAETEALLKTAFGLPGNAIKDIAAATGILPNTIYRWKSSDGHLSPSKSDALLLYFMKNEPKRLQIAERLLYEDLSSVSFP